MNKKKLTAWIIFISIVLSGCNDSQINEIKSKFGVEQEKTSIYGTYVYIENNEAIKMNGILILSYKKGNSGDEEFYGQLDVDITTVSKSSTCKLLGVLSTLDKNTYQLTNRENDKIKFLYVLKRIGEDIKINGTNFIEGCDSEVVLAIPHLYQKLN